MHKNIVIFGGMGFLGQHFAELMVNLPETKRIYLVDLETARNEPLRARLKVSTNIEFVALDIRTDSATWPKIDDISLIANFAAIHREPGHTYREYYDTNLAGAENVTRYAARINCLEIIFTSSISVYGPSEAKICEASPKIPATAYGNSKLMAELIHQRWLACASARKLTIVRPGVVYGTAERGNVSRLVRAVRGGYFVYTANEKTIKSGCYVKNLCHAMLDIHTATEFGPFNVFNMSTSPLPTLEDYVTSIQKSLGVNRKILNIPLPLLYVAFFTIEWLCKLLRRPTSINRVRLKKLTHSNNIEPEFLMSVNWQEPFSFNETFDDWQTEDPAVWR